ncbi:hypothetical protein BpHYR1_006719 [Brachionus plicatilis]|uniref:Uncharacterized protein n=1 Tax=Brachionus plicatilis TaxID=10195 RepID=A0A3M7RR47_BRAPC|nr:hypothetical protein BpHYR1_006719 [Brachionus plicatilis]
MLNVIGFKVWTLLKLSLVSLKTKKLGILIKNQFGLEKLTKNKSLKNFSDFKRMIGLWIMLVYSLTMLFFDCVYVTRLSKTILKISIKVGNESSLDMNMYGRNQSETNCEAPYLTEGYLRLMTQVMKIFKYLKENLRAVF